MRIDTRAAFKVTAVLEYLTAEVLEVDVSRSHPGIPGILSF